MTIAIQEDMMDSHTKGMVGYDMMEFYMKDMMGFHRTYMMEFYRRNLQEANMEQIMLDGHMKDIVKVMDDIKQVYMAGVHSKDMLYVKDVGQVRGTGWLITNGIVVVLIKDMMVVVYMKDVVDAMKDIIFFYRNDMVTGGYERYKGHTGTSWEDSVASYGRYDSCLSERVCGLRMDIIIKDGFISNSCNICIDL